MEAVILAGGRGTRLLPLTKDIPKSLVTIGRYPIIYHQLKLIKKSGINVIRLLLGHQGELIKKYCQENKISGLKIPH